MHEIGRLCFVFKGGGEKKKKPILSQELKPFSFS